MRPRRIEVEIGRLVVDDPAPAHPGEIAAAIERELARVRATRAALGGSPEPALSAKLGADRSAGGVGTAIGRAVVEELAR